MNKYQRLIVIAIPLLFFTNAAAGALKTYFDYVSPVPGAGYISNETTLLFRPTRALTRVRADWRSTVDIRGSRSGLHTGDWLLSDDRRTHIFKPHRRFDLGESVTVRVGIPAVAGNPRGASLAFTFTISTDGARRSVPHPHLEWAVPPRDPAIDADPFESPPSSPEVPLPPDFPSVAVTRSSSTADGHIFLTSMAFFINPRPGPYLMILDDTGRPVFFRKMPDLAFDFKKQPNGLLTYWLRGPGKFYAMDNTYTVVDSFEAGNGYTTDLHELQILPNGHALLMIYDNQTVDMSAVVEGGDSTATVIGLIIQELDTSKNVVFEWRSWDHFEITDARHRDLTAAEVDYAHGNAIELDADGHLMISSRHMDEITKINRHTGDIIWRLGGNNNEFTLSNDTVWFSYQHDIRRLPNGHITLFDNGNFNSPQESRAVEYALDEENKIVTRVWEFRNEPSTYGAFMGNAQRLQGGRTLIGWGGTTPTLTEVGADGAKTFELTFARGVFSYRAFRSTWSGVAAAPYAWADTSDGTLRLSFVKFGDDGVEKYFIYRGSTPDAAPRVASSSGRSILVRNFDAGETLYFRVTAVNKRGEESQFSNLVEITPDFSDVAPVVAADVNVAPRVLNPSSKGPWMTARIELPRESGYTAAQIDEASILLNGTVPAELGAGTEGEGGEHGSRVKVVRFARDDAVRAMAPGGSAELHVTGSVGDAVFEGVDRVQIEQPGGRRAAGGPPAGITEVVLHHNYPNPFNPGTAIRFDLPGITDVELSIYTVDGKLVRKFARNTLPAGPHRIAWDGTDARGVPVGTGVYFYRLIAGATVLTNKMVVVR